jgi:hypothetical protein
MSLSIKKGTVRRRQRKSGIWLQWRAGNPYFNMSGLKQSSFSSVIGHGRVVYTSHRQVTASTYARPCLSSRAPTIYTPTGRMSSSHSIVVLESSASQRLISQRRCLEASKIDPCSESCRIMQSAETSISISYGINKKTVVVDPRDETRNTLCEQQE